MKRLFMRNLISWQKSTRRKPLIIRGARQVGKTFIINEFGNTYYSGNVHTVNFERHPEWHSLFDQNLDPDRILKELEIVLNVRINPETDLLFFDEIQACPKAITAMRYFYEEMPDLHLIAAGSLLEFAMKDIGFPVGRVNLMELAPMNFYEFLEATGRENLAAIIVETPTRLSETVHQLLLNILKQYMFVGGMPESVLRWRETQSMKEVFSVQSDLLNTYRQDFSKYSPGVDTKALNHTLDHLSKHIGNQIKYARLSDEFTGPTNKKAFEMLLTARLIHKVCSTSASSLPFSAYASGTKFKTVFLDMGLMHSLNGLQANLELSKNDLLSAYNGGLAEQFAGQEFLSAGHNPLFYWARDAKSSKAEVDYLVERNGKIYPVEIKSGSKGTLRSMHFLLEQNPRIEHGFVLSTAQFGSPDGTRIKFLPLYYAHNLVAPEF